MNSLAGSADIAVIVPFFNRSGTIHDALASIAGQTLPAKQVVLIDDGSTDDGPRLAREWADQLGGRLRCQLVRQENAGAAAARNRGLQLTGAVQFVAFLDSDDTWPADFLERTHAALALNPQAVAASCDRRFVYADGRRSKIDDCAELAACPAIWMLAHGGGLVSSTLFRRSALVGHGGFDPALAVGEDAALFLRVSLDGPWSHVPGEAAVLNSGLAKRRGSEGNLSQKYADREFRTTQIFEEFFTTGGGQPFLSLAKCRRRLARRWRKSGVELYRSGNLNAALASFEKSRTWNPWRPACYLWIYRTRLAMRGRRWSSAAAIAPRADNEPHTSAIRGPNVHRDSKSLVARP